MKQHRKKLDTPPTGLPRSATLALRTRRPTTRPGPKPNPLTCGNAGVPAVISGTGHPAVTTYPYEWSAPESAKKLARGLPTRLADWRAGMQTGRIGRKESADSGEKERGSARTD